GINVGGNRIIKMADLRAMFVAAGAREVETYIQSGNVVFSHARPTAALFEKELAKQTGFSVQVVLRTAEEWAALAHPFECAEHVHVFFLATAAALDVAATAPEAYVVKERDVFVYLPDGMGRSKLAGALAKALPTATARNWRTVQQLAAMAIQSAR
ncbi:MAG: DUF1697 domain-containing protein, partial [Deltaproteobacteria bacterium]|nr:DUF1697 domain-containing protein [Deltaproteobacteria bacterium]